MDLFASMFTGLLSSYSSSSADAAAAMAATSMFAVFGIFYIIFIGIFVLAILALVTVVIICNWKLFEKAGMPINPDSTFWVRDTASRLFFLKEPQYYDASQGQIAATSDNETHHRLTIAYFYKSNISW